MDFHRNAAAVVGDTHAIVRQKRNLDVVGEITHRLVTRVVEDFPHEMMQSGCAGGTDVHARPAAHRLETFEYRNVTRAVRALCMTLPRFGGCISRLFCLSYSHVLCI